MARQLTYYQSFCRDYHRQKNPVRRLVPHLTDEQMQALCDSIRPAWSRDTCYPPMAENWTPGNPSYGQCAVSALFIRQYAGGEIMFSKGHNHYWNRICGVELDITREQFPEGTDFADARVLDGYEVSDLLFSEAARKALTSERFRLLHSRAYTHKLWEILRTDPANHRNIEPPKEA